MCPEHKPILTDDGSPSLVTTYENGVTEKMHHFRGALTESIYVYVPAIEWSLGQARSPAIMSLGLGLGYNELLAVAVGLQHEGPDRLRIVTFEADEKLRSSFVDWLLATHPTALDESYTAVLNQIATAMTVPAHQLKETAADLYRSGAWELRGSYPECLSSHDLFHGILYDAFSSKMDEPLWSEEHLRKFLTQHASPTCAFATYASTGNLKRSLRAHGFKMEFKPGFGGKKECTFATRTASGSGFSPQS